MVAMSSESVTVAAPAARGYGHAILDCVSAAELDDGEVVEFATRRVREVDAVVVTTDDTGDEGVSSLT